MSVWLRLDVINVFVGVYMSGGKVRPRAVAGSCDCEWTGRFRLIDRDTGLPVSGCRVRIFSSVESVCDSTDREGYTRWVSCPSVDFLRIIKDEGGGA